MADEQQLSYEEALEKVLSFGERMPAEEIDFMDSLGRVLAEDVLSDIDVAPFDNSAMDGFAVIASDLEGASEENPVTLDVIELIAAGDAPVQAVKSGQAARIMTGAAMPEGADSVVKLEFTNAYKTDLGQAGQTVQIMAPVEKGANVRYAGEEVKAGGVVVPAGEEIGVATIGLFAATGNTKVKVYRRPVVGIVATGSELVDVDEKPGPGQIRNSNSYANAAQAMSAGADVIIYPVVEDTYEATLEVFKEASEECDLIVTSGGVSVGDFDFVRPALETLGEVEFAKVNMRPGNPQTMGHIGKAILFGLPGNPSSCYVGFEAFLRPLIRKMLGYKDLARPIVKAKLAVGQSKRQPRRYFLRGNVVKDEQGEYVANLDYSQSSALLTAAHYANAFIILPEGVGYVEKDTLVDCWLLDVEESGGIF
ncbi:MAG: molybdopterin molybdotransferase MoeA [Coriobacteriia bacterium]|nr:molybdopterin molybdotransferase MoeA [Coriobacteriia bacterium]